MKDYINLKTFFNKILILFLILSFGSFAFAETGQNVSSTGSVNEQSFGSGNAVGVLCPNEKYAIKGPSDVIYNNLVDYSVNVEELINNANISKIEYKLYKGDELLGVYTGQKYNHFFATTDKFLLKVFVEDDDSCKYNIQKEINVYKDIALYIGKNDEGLDSFDSTFQKNGNLFKRINLSLTDQTFIQQLTDNIYYLKNSKNIILDYKNLNDLFETLGRIKALYAIDFNDKNVYLVNNEYINFLKRSLYKYLKLLDLKKINLIKSGDLLNVINQISLGKDVANVSESLKISEMDSGWMGFSSLVDYLIYNGFPSSLLYLILAGCLVSLIISVFRQVIGLPVFSLYSPLLFGMCLYILGIKFSLLLLLIAFIATSLVRLFTNRVYLLHSAKTSMIVILYLLFVLIYIFLDKYFKLNIIDINIFLNNYIIFPIIYISIASSKVYKEGTSFLKKTFWILFIEFMMISVISYLILSWSLIEFLMLSYPEILILVLFLQLWVGRFTGLQLMEYIRFRGLIGGEEE